MRRVRGYMDGYKLHWKGTRVQGYERPMPSIHPCPTFHVPSLPPSFRPSLSLPLSLSLTLSPSVTPLPCLALVVLVVHSAYCAQRLGPGLPAFLSTLLGLESVTIVPASPVGPPPFPGVGTALRAGREAVGLCLPVSSCPRLPPATHTDHP